MNFTVNSDTSLQTLIGTLRDEYKQFRFLRVNVKTGVDRSLSQSSISHAFYDQLARELREDTALGWKCFCKLTIGVPILRAENEEFREGYDSSIKHLTYEQKLRAMEFVPVTSLMTIPQMSQYLETMQSRFAGQVLLEFPSDGPLAA